MKNIVVCPHCEHEYTQEDMENAQWDLWRVAPLEQAVDEKCPLCGDSFIIQGGYGYIPTYKTYKTEDDFLDS